MSARVVAESLTANPDSVAAICDLLSHINSDHHDSALKAAERYITVATKEGVEYNDALIVRAFINATEAIMEARRLKPLTNGHDPSGNIFLSVIAGGSELLGREIEPPMSIIGNGVFTKSDLGVIVAEGGVGKSWLGVQLAVSRAIGTEWLGMTVDRGRTGMLLLELSAYQWQQRFRAVAGERVEDPSLDDVRIVCRPELKGVVDLASREDMAALRYWIEQEKLSLVIIDPLSRAHGLNEKEMEDMGPFLQQLDAIRYDTGCAILLIHHTRKSQGGAQGKDSDLDSASGSRALRDFPTFFARLAKKGGNRRLLTFAKVSAAAEPKPIWLEQLDSGLLVPVDAPEQIKDRNRAKIQAALADAGDRGLTIQEIMAASGLKKSAANGHCQAIGTTIVGSGPAARHYLSSNRPESSDLYNSDNA